MNFEDFCKKHNITINLIPNIGTKIRGFCYYDGIRYNVILNNRFDSEQLRLTSMHEIIHIMEDHFSCHPDYIEECENEVKTIIREMRYAFG